jgi:hypothetical protein
MKRLIGWLSQFDWGAFVGTGFAFVTYIGIISPVIRSFPVHGSEPQQQTAYSAADQAAIEKYLASETFWQRTWHDPIAFFTLVLGVSTIGLWITTWATLRHARTDSRRQAHQTRVGNLAAIKAANAAEKAANAATVSADAAIGATRAWLLPTIDGDNLEKAILQRIDPSSWAALAEHKPLVPEVRFHFDNHGKTPAFIREAAMELVISVDIPERVLAEPLAPWWPEEIIIPAGGRYPTWRDEAGRLGERITQVHGTFGADQANLFDTQNETIERFKFWFYGHILYTDVWNNLHMTRFCLANEVWSNWYMPPEAMQYNQRT